MAGPRRQDLSFTSMLRCGTPCLAELANRSGLKWTEHDASLLAIAAHGLTHVPHVSLESRGR